MCCPCPTDSAADPRRTPKSIRRLPKESAVIPRTALDATPCDHLLSTRRPPIIRSPKTSKGGQEMPKTSPSGSTHAQKTARNHSRDGRVSQGIQEPPQDTKSRRSDAIDIPTMFPKAPERQPRMTQEAPRSPKENNTK